MKKNYKYLTIQWCAYIKLVLTFLSSFSYYYKIEFFFILSYFRLGDYLKLVTQW